MPAAAPHPPAETGLDPAKWAVGKVPLPVFDCLTRDDGSKITLSDLNDIAANMQARHDAGTAIRLTVGHVQPPRDFPEALQPKVIGRWLPPFEVGTFKGEPCILAWPAVRREHLAETTGRPYRSPEYYHGRKLVTGVALLSRDPARNLGTFDLADVFAAGGEKPEQYTLSEPVNMADVMSPAAADAKPDAKPPAAPATDAPQGDDFDTKMAAYAAKTPWMAYAMKCYDASQVAAAPSATNTAVPAAGQPDAKEPETMSAAELAELHTLRAANKQYADRLAKLESESKQSKLDRVKDEMRTYGLADAELATMDALSDESLAVYVSTVRKLGTKVTPPGVADLVLLADSARVQAPGAVQSDPENGIITDAHKNHALEWLRDNASTDWAAAVKATVGKK